MTAIMELVLDLYGDLTDESIKEKLDTAETDAQLIHAINLGIAQIRIEKNDKIADWYKSRAAKI